MKKQRWEESEKRREEKRKKKIREDQRRSEKIREDQRREEKRKKKIREDQRRSNKIRKDQRRERVRRRRCRCAKRQKVATHCVFPMICGSRGSKSSLAKAAGAEPSGRMKDEKLQATVARNAFGSEKTKTFHVRSTFGSCGKSARLFWREAHLEGKMYKTHHSWRPFVSWDVEKVHADVARSTCRSQNVQNMSAWEHFWKLMKLRCWKSGRRCGAKHIWKSKCTKHTMPGALLEVEMWKKGTPLRREAHFEVKNVQNTPRSEHCWKLRCSKSVRRCGAKRLSKSECTKHRMFAPHLDVEASFCVAGARDSPPCQKRAKREGFVYIACPKTTASVGHLKRICKDGFRVYTTPTTQHQLYNTTVTTQH